MKLEFFEPQKWDLSKFNKENGFIVTIKTTNGENKTFKEVLEFDCRISYNQTEKRQGETITIWI